MSLNSSCNSPGEVAETSVHSLFNICVHMCSVLLVQRYCHVLYQCWVPVRGQSHLISSWVAVSFHSWETSMRRQAGCFLLSPVLPEAEWGQFFPSVLLRDSLSPGFPPLRHLALQSRTMTIFAVVCVSAGKSVHQQSWCGSGSSSSAGWQQEGPFKPSVVQMGTEVISWWCLFSNALLSQAPFLSFILSFEFAFASSWSHTICCFTVSWPFFPFPLQELLFCKSVARI